MRAIDTNLLVRLIARDDAKQFSAAEDFIGSGAWVSHVVLAETVWVLESVYKLDADAIGDALEMLLDSARLFVQDAEVVAAALAQFRLHPAVDFADCLILEIARRNGHLPLGTFDRDLGKLDGAERLRSG